MYIYIYVCVCVCVLKQNHSRPRDLVPRQERACALVWGTRTEGDQDFVLK